MQSTNKRIFTILITSLILCMLTALSRILNLLFNYNFETKFFVHSELATASYFFLITSILVIIFLKHLFPRYTIKSTTHIIQNTYADIFLNISIAALILLLIFPILDKLSSGEKIEKVLAYISFISGIFSIFYYIISAFSATNLKNFFWQFLNLMPAIFLCSQAVNRFSQTSDRANTYNAFADIISLLFLALIIISIGRLGIERTRKDIVTFLTSISAYFLVIFYSAIPDTLVYTLGYLQLTKNELLFLCIKWIYMIIVLIKIYKTVKNIKLLNY